MVLIGLAPILDVLRLRGFRLALVAVPDIWRLAAKPRPVSTARA